LPFRGPGDKIVAEEDTEARGRLAGVWTACPIGIAIRDEITARGAVELEAIMSGAAEISQDAFDKLKVGSGRGMHE
jgi:hypothetical protein